MAKMKPGNVTPAMKPAAGPKIGMQKPGTFKKPGQAPKPSPGRGVIPPGAKGKSAGARATRTTPVAF